MGCCGEAAAAPRARAGHAPVDAGTRVVGAVVALRDKTLPSVVMALDRALRCFGGAPTSVLTDNEKTVSVDHVCGIAVRNPQIVSVARHYGVTIATCVPADPQSKGVELAGMVVADDDRIDGRYLEVHQGALSLIARQAPVAGDLRIVAAPRDPMRRADGRPVRQHRQARPPVGLRGARGQGHPRRDRADGPKTAFVVTGLFREFTDASQPT